MPLNKSIMSPPSLQYAKVGTSILSLLHSSFFTFYLVRKMWIQYKISVFKVQPYQTFM